ncbi:MAG: TRAP transporter substrate-binding protein DctP [Alphaproteobacteria bacterium]
MSHLVFKIAGFATTIALAAGLAMPAAAQRIDGPRVQWNLNTHGPKRAATAGFEELARVMHEATAGNFEIRINYGEALGPAKEVLDATSIGAYELGFACVGYAPGKLPTVEGVGLPFLPTPSIHHVRALREGYMAHPVPLRDVARWGSLYLTSMPSSSNEFLGKGKPPKALSDFKGMRVRAQGGEADAMRLLGAVPTNLPAPEIYQGMERGLLDASSTLYYAHAAYKTHEVANWYTTNLALSSSPCLLVASSKALDALPPQYRKLMTESIPAVVDHWVKALDADDLKAAEMFKEKRLVPVTFVESDLENLRRQVRPIWDRWVADMDKLGHNGKELLQLMLDSAKKARVS